MSEQVFQERHTCLVDCGLPAEQCACYMAEYELTHVDKADAWDAIVEKSREITRLRAALADAQAVGFAAGVEAAAKAGANAAQQLALRRNPDLSPLRQQLIKQAITNPIRALTPPETTAAAASVLLGVWPTDASFDAAFNACAASYHGGDQMQDVMDRTRETVSAALRTMAGDTP